MVGAGRAGGMPVTKLPTGLELQRAVGRHRALLAAGLAAGAVAASLNVLAPHARSGVTVLIAARDLAAGTTLAAPDVSSVALPALAVPSGALRLESGAIGRVLAGPMRRGEPLTDVRLAGAGLLPASSTGLVGVPVRLADAASAALVTAGDRVDVLAAGTAAGGAAQAQVVAADVEVLAVPTAV